MVRSASQKVKPSNDARSRSAEFSRLRIFSEISKFFGVARGLAVQVFPNRSPLIFRKK